MFEKQHRTKLTASAEFWIVYFKFWLAFATRCLDVWVMVGNGYRPVCCFFRRWFRPYSERRNHMSRLTKDTHSAPRWLSSLGDQIRQEHQQEHRLGHRSEQRLERHPGRPHRCKCVSDINVKAKLVRLGDAMWGKAKSATLFSAQNRRFAYHFPFTIAIWHKTKMRWVSVGRSLKGFVEHNGLDLSR